MAAVELAPGHSHFSPLGFQDTCPTCEQTIPTERIAAVRGRLATLERELTASISTQFDRIRLDDQAKAQHDLRQAQEESARALDELRQQAAASVSAAQTAAEATEARVRDELERIFQQRWNTNLKAVEESHAADVAQREAKVAEVEATLHARLQQMAHEREQSEEQIKAQLLQAEQQRTQYAQAARDASVQLERAHREARDAMERLREEMNAHMTQQLQAQAASIEAKNKRAIEQAEIAGKAAVEAAKAEFIQRETQGQALLQDLHSKLAAADAARASAEQRLGAAEEGKAAELTSMREILEADKKAAVLAEQAKRFQETQKLSADLDDLRRKLEKKTNEELGEGEEIVLFEALKQEFKEDLITEVKRGTQGADLVHEIRVNGVVCGTMVYDSKNRKDWKNEYAKKLRDDQVAARAEHAILSTNRFPGGKRQLHIQDDVIIACPARVLALAKLLREQVVTMHSLRISNEQREKKTAQLYEFIASARFSQLLESVNRQLTTLEKIEVDERKSHDSVWIKRGKAFKAIEKANGDLRFEISQIIGGLAEPAEGEPQ
jgi:hypothetical protein